MKDSEYLDFKLINTPRLTSHLKFVCKHLKNYDQFMWALTHYDFAKETIKAYDCPLHKYLFEYQKEYVDLYMTTNNNNETSIIFLQYYLKEKDYKTLIKMDHEIQIRGLYSDFEFIIYMLENNVTIEKDVPLPEYLIIQFIFYNSSVTVKDSVIGYLLTQINDDLLLRLIQKNLKNSNDYYTLIGLDTILNMLIIYKKGDIRDDLLKTIKNLQIRIKQYTELLTKAERNSQEIRDLIDNYTL